jgi:hypothetical protein
MAFIPQQFGTLGSQTKGGVAYQYFNYLDKEDGINAITTNGYFNPTKDTLRRNDHIKVYDTVNNIRYEIRVSALPLGGDVETEVVPLTVEAINADYINFSCKDPSNFPDDAGVVYCNPDNYSLDFKSGLGPVAQIPYETWVLVYNDTGGTLANGAALNGTQNVNGALSVVKAQANYHNNIANVLIATMEIPDQSFGIATEFGLVRDLDTTAIPGSGPLVYVSPTIPGTLTRTRPEFPDFRILVGAIVKEGTTDGEATITIRERARDTLFDTWDGCIRETINFLVSSDGATVTGSLTNAGDSTRDLTLIFSDGFTILDTTPAVTITLTPGSDDIPQENYVYIPKSTKVLTVSTSDWPVETEHIRVAKVVLRSAATTQTDSALGNQNWNDHVKKEDDNGHLLHITEKLRQFEAQWHSGAEGSATIGAGGEVWIKNTAGVIYQLHRQNFAVIDMTQYSIDAVSTGSKTFTISDDGDLTSTFPDGRIIQIHNSTGNDGQYTIVSTSYAAPNFIITVEETIPSSTADGTIGDDIHIVNDFSSPYKTLIDLSSQTLDASGAALNNTSYSIVVWGVMNKTGEQSHLMANMPTGTYNKNFPQQAVDDATNQSVYEIPKTFQGVGFLIARFTFVNNGGVWSLYDTEDLRGRIPNTTAGGGGGGAGVTSFLGLTDTPSAYTSQAGRVPTVNSGETALEFVDMSGSVQMFAGSTAPTGWLLCDGAAISRTTYAALFATIGTSFGIGDGSTTFNIPDFRGIFPRGAGTNGTLTNANGSAFSGTLGTYQNDKEQGHKHLTNIIYPIGVGGTLVVGAGTTYAFGPQASGVPGNDGTNGVPRTGAETNPANLGINFIIKT